MLVRSVSFLILKPWLCVVFLGKKYEPGNGNPLLPRTPPMKPSKGSCHKDLQWRIQPFEYYLLYIFPWKNEAFPFLSLTLQKGIHAFHVLEGNVLHHNLNSGSCRALKILRGSGHDSDSHSGRTHNNQLD